MNDSVDRRRFLKRAGSAAVGLGFAARAGSAVGPNNRIRVAAAGTNSRGLALIECLGNASGA